MVSGVCCRPNAEILGCAFVPTGETTLGPNGPVAEQVKTFVTPPAPVKVHPLLLRVLAGYKPCVVLAKKVEVALLVGSP